MVTSGSSAITSAGSDSPVAALTVGTGTPTRLTLINEGPNPGFFSTDGTNYARLPAGPSSTSMNIGPTTVPGSTSMTLWVKRVAGGPDISGVWAWAE